MKSRTRWVLITLTFVLIASYVAYTLLSGENSKASTEDEVLPPKASEVHFGKWRGNVVFTDETQVKVFNLVYVEKGKNSKLDDLVSVSFNGKGLFKVKDFEVAKGDQIGNQKRIGNLIVNISPGATEGIETISEISLFFKEGEPEVHKIGEFTVMVKPNGDNQDIIAEGSYNASYPNTTFNGTFKNNTNKPITIKKLYNPNEEITYKNIMVNEKPLDSEIVVDAGDTFTIEADFDLSSQSNRHFFQLVPVFQYLKEGKENEQFFMETTYGLMGINDEVVENIINSKN
ncbi:hypothetical protein [Rossellomorea sp. y25]|uniref:hypothetical protein n=1 Tax=Rossellomorea sp. y25 TaxID=3118174 RepID=UPI0030E3FC26